MLVYALMIALLFSLLLQFYLQANLNEKRALRLQKERAQAEFMLALYRQKKGKRAGELTFNQGKIKAEKAEEGWNYKVELSSGGQFNFFKRQ